MDGKKKDGKNKNYFLAFPLAIVEKKWKQEKQKRIAKIRLLPQHLLTYFFPILFSVLRYRK